MKKRNIGLDLLRIISMIMIVSLHVLGKGEFLSEIKNEKLYLVSYIGEIFCIVAVNCYILISGYFSTEVDFQLLQVNIGL